jgi:hypothetical protein
MIRSMLIEREGRDRISRLEVQHSLERKSTTIMSRMDLIGTRDYYRLLGVSIEKGYTDTKKIGEIISSLKDVFLFLFVCE